MKLLVINGPNMNMLGTRQPEIYGTATYKQLIKSIKQYCNSKKVKVKFYQSNHEGKIIDRIQKAQKEFDGIVINPAAYTHTSLAVADALTAVNLPYTEVHISDISQREDYRKKSFISENAVAVISGKGTAGYFEAIDILLNQ